MSLHRQQECLPIGKNGHMSPFYREVSSGGTVDHLKRRASPSVGVAGGLPEGHTTGKEDYALGGTGRGVTDL